MVDENVPAIPGYVVGPLIGRGGMGTVYRAHEVATHRDVAIKVLPQSASASQQGRFAREVRAAAALRHPHIVTLYTAGVAPCGQYLVMELVDGFTLEQVMESRTLGPGALADLIAKIARALAVAHEAGVIHRDVKPTNILVDRTGAPRIVDFGLARYDDGAAPLTGAGVALGTLVYISPEVLERGARHATPATDVFSLGCVLYEGLVGRPPFLADDARELIARVLEARVPPLPETVPAPLAAICTRSLARDPAQRPSARELAEKLEAFAASGRAPPADSSARSRMPFALLAVATIAVALALALVARNGRAPSTLPTPSPETRPVESPAPTPPPVVAPVAPTAAPPPSGRAASPDPSPVAAPSRPPADPLFQFDLAHDASFDAWWLQMIGYADVAAIESFARSALERGGNGFRRAQILTVIGRAEFLEDKWDAARQHLDEAVKLSEERLQHALVVRFALAVSEKDAQKAASVRAKIDESHLAAAIAIEGIAADPSHAEEIAARYAGRSRHDRFLVRHVLQSLTKR